MPAGLAGTPEPIRSEGRDQLLRSIAEEVEPVGGPRVLVGIDGRSGSGKSTFGDELAALLEERGATVVRSTIDSFHRPRHERMRQGPASPDGYYEDSHQLAVVASELLAPFQKGADEVLISAFDEPADRADRRVVSVPPEAVLVFDGLFLHRPELVGFWDRSVVLHADRRCDAAWLAYLEGDLPDDPIARARVIDQRLERARWPRYRHGWQRYADAVGWVETAIHIDNDDLAAPKVVPTP